MTLWLVRHAQPLVAPGVCYGALDIAADAAATEKAARALAAQLPRGVPLVSSPLQRCEQLTHCLRGLRPDLMPEFDPRLAEMDFGAWEGRHWDAIARAEIDAWTGAFATTHCGGGECVQDFMARVAAAWEEAHARGGCVIWVTHAGVIRAAQLLAAGQRQITRADQWPHAAPAFGQWCVVDMPAC